MDVTGCASGDMNNGVKKEAAGKDAARMWLNEDLRVHSFSHSLVSLGGVNGHEARRHHSNDRSCL